MKKFLLIISLFTLLFSCSKDNDNSNDKIVGSWILMEVKQGTNVIDYDPCWEFVSVVYTEDNLVHAEILDNPPDECNFGLFEIYWWKKIGTNSYEIGIGNEVLANIQFDGDFLIRDSRATNGYIRKYRGL